MQVVLGTEFATFEDIAVMLPMPQLHDLFLV